MWQANYQKTGVIEGSKASAFVTLAILDIHNPLSHQG